MTVSVVHLQAKLELVQLRLTKTVTSFWQANQLEERCRADVLEWGTDASHLSPPVDYVVGSDILYDM